MTKKTTTSEPVAEATYSNVYVTCIRASKLTPNGKTVTHYASNNDDIIESWSFANKPDYVALGTKVLLRAKRMPDGKVFYNLQ